MAIVMMMITITMRLEYFLRDNGLQEYTAISVIMCHVINIDPTPLAQPSQLEIQKQVKLSP